MIIRRMMYSKRDLANLIREKLEKYYSINVKEGKFKWKQ